MNLVTLPGNLHGDSYFLLQEKLKAEYLEQLPGMMKLFSQFLGKQTWFVGEKVKEKKLGVVILPRGQNFMPPNSWPFSDYFCGFPCL